MAFKEDFIQGRALRSISAAWLNGIAKALNSLSIRFDPNAKQPRIEKPPMPSGRSGWAIVLPPYPAAGEEGGEVESGLQLGPLEYTTETVGGVKVPYYRQYMGRWEYTPGVDENDGAWSFSRATDEDGNELPAAKVYKGSTFRMMIRSAESSGNIIETVPVPLFNVEDDPTTFLQQRVATVVESVDFSAPSDETGNGELSASTSTIHFWSQQEQSSPSKKTLLTTITENANESKTYEDA